MADPAANPAINPVNNDGDGNNVPIHSAQAVQSVDGGVNLKVEQMKLPKFWGQKEKDSITPNEFNKRIRIEAVNCSDSMKGTWRMRIKVCSTGH